jgi:hypothetical protein
MRKAGGIGSAFMPTPFQWSGLASFLTVLWNVHPHRRDSFGLISEHVATGAPNPDRASYLRMMDERRLAFRTLCMAYVEVIVPILPLKVNIDNIEADNKPESLISQPTP